MKTSESKTSSETNHTTALFGTEAAGKSAPFFAPKGIQPTLRIGQPGDKYEQQADRVADAVMRMPEPSVQRQADEEEELQMKMEPEVQRKCRVCEEDEKIQTKTGEAADSATASPGLSSELQSRKGKGSRLPGTVQVEMESKIGADFSGVHIHTDSPAAQMNRQLGARAFTHGSDIYFNKGEYNPNSGSGKHLLAHELTHVVQQSALTDFKAGNSPMPVQMQQSNSKETGIGVVTLERITNNYETWRLYNFNVGSADLKSGHIEGLQNNIMQKIPLNQSTELRIALIGHASRTGNDIENLSLSRRRAIAVYEWMLSQGVAESVFLGEPVSALGERSPLERGTPDEKEVSEDRAVRIQIWHADNSEIQVKCDEVKNWQWSALFDHHLDACNAIYYLGKGVFDSICQGVPPQVCVASWTLQDVSEDLKKLYRTCCTLPDSADQKSTRQKVYDCVIKDVQSEIERQLSIPCSKNRVKEEYRKWTEKEAVKVRDKIKSK